MPRANVKILSQRIPKDLYDKVEMEATRLGMSINAYLNLALERQLNDEFANEVRQRLNRLEEAVFRDR